MELAEMIAAAASFELHGSHEVVALGSPAAGQSKTHTVSGAVQQSVLSISFTFTASAQAADRYPFVRFLDQSDTAFCEVGSPYKLVASDASRITFGVGVQQFGADSAIRIGAGIPELRLQDGLRVQIGATGIDAADTITAARLYVRQVPVQPIVVSY